MTVKRYLADDITQAMDKVRAELGRDAFLLNTRKIRRRGLGGMFRHPLVEVVAAYEPPPPPPSPPSHLPSESSPSELFVPFVPENAYTMGNTTALPREGNEAGKMRQLESKLDDISATLGELAEKMHSRDDAPAGLRPEIERLMFCLEENDVHDEFAAKIAREAEEVINREDADPRDVCEQIIRQYLGEPSPIRLKKYKRTVAVFLGPTGVGKTTTVAKLAAIYALKHHARVGVITTDTTRVAAVEQIKTYAEILKVPLSVAYTLDEMKDALAQFDNCDVVFIDTAGKSPQDPSLQSDTLSLIRESDADEVHLVLSATTSFSSCVGLLGAYTFMKDFKLLFTKLDESATWGALLNFRFLSDRMISFVANGQNVPDDIEVMDPGKVAGRLMGG